jgi:hypothetical protein
VILACVLLGRVIYCLCRYFIDFVDFACHAQASQPVEPAHVSSPHFIITMPEADMVNPSSSDTEEALDLVFLSPTHCPCSPASNLLSGSNSDVFKDWPEANNMVVSVYVALTADALSSRASTTDNLCAIQESCTGGSSGQWSRSRTASSKKPRQRKTALTGTSWRKSKKMKVDAERALVAPTPRGGSLSATDFDKNEWEIMYPCFVEEGLIDPSEHVNTKRVNASYMYPD